MPRMLQRLCLLGGLVFLPAPGWAQVRRYPAEVLDDVALLLDVINAYLEEVDVDNPPVRAARFPDRALADFDRDRDGAFYTLGTRFGLVDVDEAIAQFLHDPVDHDGDGLIGFGCKSRSS